MTEPTKFCPRGARCESCGTAGPGLSVKVYDVLSEKMCLTVCSGCRDSDRPPSVMLSTAQRLVEQHRQHVAGPDRPIYRIHLPS
jgi:ribosome-binding protein aMBF1 (putative translation factor)